MDIECTNHYLIDSAKPTDEALAPLKKATGASEREFGAQLLTLCADACGIDSSQDFGVLQLANTLTDMAPQDEIEGMLLTKILALHKQSMSSFAVVGAEDAPLELRERLLNMATKLSRLQNECVDTLTRYRRRGEQRVLVQHVNIEGGGKAVVGNVIGGGIP